MSWFNKLKDFGNTFLTLGKRAVNWTGQTLGKVAHAANKGINFMNSKPIRGLVKSASEFIPGLQDGYSATKKFGHLANNYSRMGTEAIRNGKSFLNDFDRRKKMKDDITQAMPKYGRPTMKKKYQAEETMERPKRQVEEPDFLNSYNF